jgi:hypothetical protein
VSDINVTAVRLGTVPATWGNIDGNKLMVKFNRQTVIDYIWALKLYSMRIEWPYSLPKEGVEVMRPITGEFYNGTLFEGSATIRVIYTG